MTDLMKSRVVLGAHNVSHVSSSDFPHNYDGDLAWDIEKFKKNFKVVVGSLNEMDMEFDLIGIDAAIANAFRRILIAEVPTMAIESIFFHDNNSVLFDEVLAHRIGLVPLNADPRLFEFRQWDDTPTDLNTIVFRLEVKCTTNPKALPDEVDPKQKYINSNVYSKDLIWQPKGAQEEVFADKPIKPVHDDILLAKLRPGQSIVMDLHAQKGVGKEHAKWSPVATASYRLLPDIQILKPITGDDAIKFQKCFPKGTIEIEKGQAYVANPRKDTASRECLRHKEFEDKVRLTRVRDHFIFSIESTGALTPDALFESAAQVLIDKCKNLKQALNDMGLPATYDE
ncbi:DNA-directed RNA polymerase core subunit rpc40 [Boothiomyces sp. JEL0838]|nr:DNA-directed RNA polymerase core subunit rpc40 [Boothiomyces sp. JEL0838]